VGIERRVTAVRIRARRTSAGDGEHSEHLSTAAVPRINRLGDQALLATSDAGLTA
jgi:hypothetical protein